MGAVHLPRRGGELIKFRPPPLRRFAVGSAASIRIVEREFELAVLLVRVKVHLGYEETEALKVFNTGKSLLEAFAKVPYVLARYVVRYYDPRDILGPGKSARQRIVGVQVFFAF